MKDFKCPICGGPTKQIWENETKTRYGMRCREGHKKIGGSQEYPVFLVPSKDLV